ncbi:MAG: gliding motility-associated ABC transporter substrate-binding protein GldG [Bacteroidales bacterium]|jgi:ABC-2 type transport system permease protein|nr:gliding motility-associated ABC transporter substrate-binding protein GldG [Bacteroidales bacterium]
MKKRNIRQCIILLCGIVLVAMVSSKYSFRIDLTAEKRYTLSPETIQALRRLDAPLYVDIFLDGDLPVQFRKLRNSICEMLDDFKAYSGSRIIYHLIDPAEANSRQEREKYYAGLEESGIRGININKTNKDGSLSQQIIFPGAILSYRDRRAAINLLRGNNRMVHYETALNASLEALEYELAKTVTLLNTDSVGRVAFTIGHGEPGRAETYDLANEFAGFYEVDRKAIHGQLNALDPYRAVIIAKPREAFDEKDKFVIDRYIMRGGKVMWLINGADVNTDSLFSTGITYALASELNLDDQLFTYGVRINPDVIQDIVSHPVPVRLADDSSQPVLAPWLYYPLVNPSPHHVITRNLSPVCLRYASDIDTVGRDNAVRKSVLLQTSEMSRTKGLPFMITLSEVEHMPEQQQFNRPHRITGVLLEGEFPSVFRSRNARNLFPDLQEKQAEKSVPTKMLVISDGNVACNDVRYTPNGPVPAYPLGYDRYTRETFANREFLVNALNYLTDDTGLMNLRNREFKLRLLNRQKVASEQLKWQIINLVLPMFLLLAGGLAYNGWRRFRYGNYRPKTAMT